MELAEKLDDLRLKFPGCRTLAFADISTGMVLCASAADHLRQEHLDSLCSTAAEMLNGSIAKPVCDAFADNENTGIFQAIIIEPTEIGIFLKSRHNPADALCCVCAPTIELGAFLQDARENLSRFGQDV